jgi:hypothetical protein
MTPIFMATDPRCFVLAFNLAEECKQAGGDKPALTVIQNERECDSFMTWQPGFSPKGHREMLFHLEAKKLALQQKENDREWEEKRVVSDREWEERRTSKDRRWQVLIAIFSALAGALFGALCTSVVSK